MSIYRRGETWWVYLTHNGRRIRLSAKTADRKEAQEYHDRLKADLWNTKNSGHTLSDAFKLWLTAQPRTNNEKNAILLFMSLYPNRPISEITGKDIAAALVDKGPSHANRILNIVRAALNLAKSEWGIQVPVIPRRKSPPGRIRWITPQEWERLYMELPDHIKPMALFAVSTGLRQKNVFGLKWEQIDMRRKVAWLHGDETKTRKPIGIPLSKKAMEALQSVHGVDKVYVFTYKRNPVGSVKTAWGKALKRAGISNFTWHDLRHTWASWHVQNGTPLAVLKELGGWASMDMVTRYAHLSPEHIAVWAENSRPHEMPQNHSKPNKHAVMKPPPKG